MKKIISLFERDYTGNRQVFDSVVPGAEWVQNGEGVATEKIDGTSCLFKDGKLFKRYDAKKGKTPPIGFIAAQDPDEKTGHWPGWLAIGNGPEDQWHREALGTAAGSGTYELVGPKVQGNPYGLLKHALIVHGLWKPEDDPPRTFDALKAWFATHEIEGIVWHRENGDMVKIKRKDFGYEWPIKRSK